MPQPNSNISISSLLDSGTSSSYPNLHQEPQQQGSQSSTSNANRNGLKGNQRSAPILEMVSKYKTSINLTVEDPEVIVISDTPSPAISRRNSPPGGQSSSSTTSSSSSSTTSKSKLSTSQQPRVQQIQSNRAKKENSTTSPTPITATPALLSEKVKKFQTNFQLNPITSTSPSKTSINSIINLDEGTSGNVPPPAPPQLQPSQTTISTSQAGSTASNGTKRKRTLKVFDPKKRRSGSPASKTSTDSPKQQQSTKEPTATTSANVQAIAAAPIQAKNSTTIALPQKTTSQIKGNTASTTTARAVSKSTLGAKSQSQTLQKSPAIEKKSTPGTTTPTLTPSSSTTGVSTTTEKNDPVIPVKVSRPTVIDLLNIDDDEGEDITKEDGPAPARDDKSSEKSKDKEKEKEKEKEAPIIALDIPLLNSKNPQPGGKAEVIVNVLKLAEEKYGWGIMHPNSKNALDIMDDMIDDDDEDDNDEDEDIIEVPNPSLSSASVQNQQQSNTGNGSSGSGSGGGKESGQLSLKGKELTEEQLYRQHEVKMIRKVGKYDFEDPFIDDEELQIEEDISSTKEGFFVYWGPLVDEKTVTKIKKKR